MASIDATSWSGWLVFAPPAVVWFGMLGPGVERPVVRVWPPVRPLVTLDGVAELAPHIRNGHGLRLVRG